MIKFTQVSKSYDGGQTYAVKEINLTIKQGETLVILGSSGSGKTTLLKLINLLIPTYEGNIEIHGQDQHDLDPVALRRTMGYVFQGVGLFPHMTVAENISIVLRLQGIPKEQRHLRAQELLQFIDLDPAIYAMRMPDELSGGQQQRVGVARALANEPEILLMDEPFGALDSITRDSLQEDFKKLKNRLNKTVVFVTHDIFEALRLADRIAIMHAGQLEQIGTKHDILENPASPFVRELCEKPAKQLARYQELFT